MTEVKMIINNRLGETGTASLFDFLTSQWRARNAENFAHGNDCYKIVTCDPLDDTVDQFSNLMIGVASKLCKTDYNSEDWKVFFESILYLVEYESKAYDALEEGKQKSLT